MQKNYESFSICLDRIIRERDITAAQLTRILAHKSKTTLSRVFSGTAGLDSIRKICREVCDCAVLELTHEEKEALELSVRVDEVGEAVLRARDEIRELLRPTSHTEPTIVMKSTGESVTLRQMTEHVLNADSVEMLIINCSFKALAQELHSLLGTMPMEKLTVRHFMALNNDPARTASMIGTLTGLFGFVNYSCCSMRSGSDPTGCLAFMGTNCITMRVTENATVREYQMMFTDEHSGVMLESKGIFAYWEQYISQLNTSARSIKTTYPRITSAEDYVSFTDTYRKIEENRNIYMFKPDICLNQIETDIIRSACIDGARENGMDIPDFMETLEKLAAIQDARFRNTFTQKKAAHIVFSPSAIRRFAMTGYLSDHFFLMRAYTVDERIRILSHLVHQLRTNPYFNIYLLKDDRRFTDMEATCYEGEGVQFIPPHTDYNLSSGHTEAIITNEEFCDLFLRFFRDDLLKNHVAPASAAVTLFESLIDELNAMKTE